MKKILKTFLSIFLVLFAFSSITAAYSFFIADDGIKFSEFLKSLVNFTETKKSTYVIGNGTAKKAIQVKKIDAGNYFTSSNYDSKETIIDLYKDNFRTINFFEEYTVKPIMYMYYEFEIIDDNNKSSSLILKTTINFDVEKQYQDFNNPNDIPDVEIVSIDTDIILPGGYVDMFTITSEGVEYSDYWQIGIAYDNVKLVDSYSAVAYSNEQNKSMMLLSSSAYKFGSKTFDFNNIELKNKNFISLGLKQYNKSEIQIACNTLYYDLFEIINIAAEEDSINIRFCESNLLSLSTKNFTKLSEPVENVSYSYDINAYGDNPISDLYCDFMNSYGTDDYIDSYILLETSYKNAYTLDERHFYLRLQYNYEVIDEVYVSKDFSTSGSLTLYEEKDGKIYECLNIIDGSIYYKNDYNSSKLNLDGYRNSFLDNEYVYKSYDSTNLCFNGLKDISDISSNDISYEIFRLIFVEFN